jgi:hypothetical protein
MNADVNIKSRKRLPYWLVLPLGVVLTVIVANFLFTMSEIGGFETWRNLQSPPSPSTHIINADGNVVWVETKDKEIFELTVNCYRENCFQWIKTDEDIPSYIEGAGIIIYRGTDCKSLNSEIFPLSPYGEMIECVKVANFGAGYGSVTYFALMTDGTLKYWANGNTAFVSQLMPICTTYILPLIVAVLITVAYLIKNSINHDQSNVKIKTG